MRRSRGHGGVFKAYEEVDCAVPYAGHLLTGDDLEEVAPLIQAILRDDAGAVGVRQALLDLADTDFAVDVLDAVLAAPAAFEEWRVGEALAEHHLSTERSCCFPWPDSRSTRNPGSSGGGVDLIGFAATEPIRFAFAEVKTSHQQAWPPSVVTSRSHGLHTQLSGLNAHDDRSRWAIRYLGLNAIDRPWFGLFRSAMRSYLNDQNDVVIYGVLVHFADPDPRDLRARSNALAAELRDGTTLALIGLYATSELLAEIVGAPIEVETSAA